MTAYDSTRWPFPGSRWWKFDFHTHTPASLDTTAWQKVIGTENEITPERWLMKFMAASIDCVAVTDHNSGAWIDKLKEAYGQLKERAESGAVPEGFRELTIFPGVEISVSGGLHILAVFEPGDTTRTITDLLARVDYNGKDGLCDDVTRKSPVEVVEAIISAGGVPIPAHADQEKGLLQVKPNTLASVLDANAVSQVMAIEDLHAVECVSAAMQAPTFVDKEFSRLARVIGSDCHNFRGARVPGSRYSWVKMATPSLEGLRLALLDGNGVSIRRCDGGDFGPFETPSHFVTAIEIDSARFMGNSSPERLELTPYYNALIGGRGTGKSTIVHAMRLAFRRNRDLDRLGDNSDPYRQFRSFAEVFRTRDSEGALRDSTHISVEFMRDGTMHRLHWRQDGSGSVVEEQNDDGTWQESTSQTINAERFPVRLLSQGQIASLAGDGRRALLTIIDEAAGIGDLHRKLGDARQTYHSMCARLRELAGRLAERPETERKLIELKRKLAAFARSQHGTEYEADQHAKRQLREVGHTKDQLQGFQNCLKALEKDLVLDDWPNGTFDPSVDQDVLSWRTEVESVVGDVRKSLAQAAQSLEQSLQTIDSDRQLDRWRERTRNATAKYQSLQATLAKQGIQDTEGFGRLVQEQHQFEEQLRSLDRAQSEKNELEAKIRIQSKKVLDARTAITRARYRFLAENLAANSYVRMKVVGFGFDARAIERDLRELLEVQDERFEGDILIFGETGQPKGLAAELAAAEESATAIADIQQRLISVDENMGGHFRNYLSRKLRRPEFADHIMCWYPSDDLKIEYSRSGDGRDWSAITQASQGQRSAALLAFLLAFGDEPLVLDQPEDDLDNHLIYELIVQQIRENKRRRQLIIVTHNPNIVVNGDAEMVHALAFQQGQCRVTNRGALQERDVRTEVCEVMEGGQDALSRRWARLARTS